MKPKRYLQTAVLGLISMHSGINMDHQCYNKPLSIFQGQIAYHEAINTVDDDLNDMYPLSYLASKSNIDVLYYNQAMKAEDADDFRKAMGKEIQSFKDEGIFELIHLKNKPSHKTLIPFIWSFKRKRNPMGELIKHKA